jgi:nucleotide-binding universal stress UspA family protein
MLKYNKILVAYDGSKSAKNALVVAARMAKRDNSWVKVLDVVSPYNGEPELTGDSNIREAVKGPAEQLLEEARQIAEKEGVQISTALAQGEPYERITAIAEEEDCDLIVMGRQGISHLERELMGSVTARVIGHSTRDVLVVPESFIWDGQLKSVLLATDGSSNCSAADDVTLKIAEQRSIRVAAISVTKTDISSESAAFSQAAARGNETKAKKILRDFKERAAAKNIDVETYAKHGQPHQEITALAVELGVTAIVMCTHGKTGIKRLLMGSVTQRTIGYADCPVLVVR